MTILLLCEPSCITYYYISYRDTYKILLYVCMRSIHTCIIYTYSCVNHPVSLITIYIIQTCIKYYCIHYTFSLYNVCVHDVIVLIYIQYSLLRYIQYTLLRYIQYALLSLLIKSKLQKIMNCFKCIQYTDWCIHALFFFCRISLLYAFFSFFFYLFRFLFLCILFFFSFLNKIEWLLDLFYLIIIGNL